MKARIKTFALSALTALAIFTTVTYTSCNNDPCKAIVCAFGGTCVDGDCICPSGFEGTHCEIVTRDKYKGVWTVFEDGTATKPANYQAKFTYGDGNTDLKISNFYNRFPNADVNVRVKGDSIFIPPTEVNNYKIKGWGILEWENFYPEHGEIKLYYQVVTPEGKIDDYGLSSGDPATWSR